MVGLDNQKNTAYVGNLNPCLNGLLSLQRGCKDEAQQRDQLIYLPVNEEHTGNVHRNLPQYD